MGLAKDFSFPCDAEYSVGNGIWRTCICLGVFNKGSTVCAGIELLQYWLIIDEEGNLKQIFNLKHVRFINFINKTS
jgi:hypothetical protein